MSNLSRRLTFASALAAFGVSVPSIVDSLPKHPKPVYGRVVHSGGTFNAGRNAEKRKARAAERDLRIQLIAINPGQRMPKQHLSRLTVDMLANRRLRQVGSRG